MPRSAQVEILEPDDESKFVIIDGRFTFVSGGARGGYLPFVGSAEAVGLLPSVTIDEGAMKYIIKGADVMRPGISRYDEWGEEESWSSSARTRRAERPRSGGRSSQAQRWQS